MKLFFTIFGAILAAAAVIWAVVAHNQEQDRKAHETLRVLKLMNQVAEIQWDNLSNGGERAKPDKHSLNEPATFAKFMKDPLPVGTDADALRREFETFCELAIQEAKKSQDPETLEWADQMAKNMESAFRRK